MPDRDQRFSEESMMLPEEETAPPTKLSPLLQINSEPKEKLVKRMKDKMTKMNLFAGFCENPSNVGIQNQESDEKVLLFLRKSQWINFFWIATTGFLLILPFLIYLFRSNFVAYLPPLRIILLSIPLYYLLIAIYAFLHFITWYYNAAIITTKRIINIDFHQLVMKDVAETKISLVQDVSYNQEGVLPNMFGYGHVLIQTAGTLDNFEFYQLPQPARVVEILEGLIGRNRYNEP